MNRYFGSTVFSIGTFVTKTLFVSTMNFHFPFHMLTASSHDQLTSTLSLAPTDATEYISLSVQGSVFRLTKQFLFIDSGGWMVPVLLKYQSLSPSDNGIIFLDFDPICFRIIVSLLSKITTLEFEIKRISSAELAPF